MTDSSSERLTLPNGRIPNRSQVLAAQVLRIVNERLGQETEPDDIALAEFPLALASPTPKKS
jgi:hypothetical protein